MKIDSSNKGYSYHAFETNLLVVKKKAYVLLHELLAYLVNSYTPKEFNR